MSTDKQTQVLKLALEALERVNTSPSLEDWHHAFDEEVTAIREALVDSALERMAENAREIGLDYGPIVERVEDSIGMGNGAWDMVEPKELAKAFHEALAEQPAQQQEPVGEAYLCDKCQTPFDGAYYCPECGHNTATKESVYTSPPAQRTWIGVTDEEIEQVCVPLGAAMLSFTEVARAIEAKLKEKNGF